MTLLPWQDKWHWALAALPLLAWAAQRAFRSPSSPCSWPTLVWTGLTAHQRTSWLVHVAQAGLTAFLLQVPDPVAPTVVGYLLTVKAVGLVKAHLLYVPPWLGTAYSALHFGAAIGLPLLGVADCLGAGLFAVSGWHQLLLVVAGHVTALTGLRIAVDHSVLNIVVHRATSNLYVPPQCLDAAATTFAAVVLPDGRSATMRSRNGGWHEEVQDQPAARDTRWLSHVCAVCCEPLGDGRGVVLPLTCGAHALHRRCLKPTLARCPACNDPLLTDVVYEGPLCTLRTAARSEWLMAPPARPQVHAWFTGPLNMSCMGGQTWVQHEDRGVRHCLLIHAPHPPNLAGLHVRDAGEINWA